MDMENYIKNRVDDQIEWYDKKSQTSQKLYKRTQIIEIILAASIPILVPYVQSCKCISILVALSGSIISILEAITRLYKFHENWIQYRTTSELLKYHKYLYLTKSAPYNEADETIENVFVRNIESIISSENNTWKAINTNAKQDGDNN